MTPLVDLVTTADPGSEFGAGTGGGNQIKLLDIDFRRNNGAGFRVSGMRTNSEDIPRRGTALLEREAIKFENHGLLYQFTELLP